MKKLMPMVSALLLAVAIVGCSTNKRLVPGGAYAPIVTNVATGEVSTNADFALYEVDATFATAYDALDLAFTFERNNRATLWKMSPQIKHTLDKIRPVAKDAVKRYAAARQTYIKSGATGDLSTMKSILAEIQSALAAVQSAIASGSTTVK